MRPTTNWRDRIVPINKKYPIAELMDACPKLPGLTNARRITFEYVMLRAVNDSPTDARALNQADRRHSAKVNLIRSMPGPAHPSNAPATRPLPAFSDIVFNAGYASPERTAARSRHHGCLRPVEEREHPQTQNRALTRRSRRLISRAAPS